MEKFVPLVHHTKPSARYRPLIQLAPGTSDEQTLGFCEATHLAPRYWTGISPDPGRHWQNSTYEASGSFTPVKKRSYEIDEGTGKCNRNILSVFQGKNLNRRRPDTKPR